MKGPRIRLGEMVATLSLATDLALGRPLEHELRTSLIAWRLGERLALPAEARRVLWYLALVRYLGCTGHAHEVAAMFGDDLAARARADLYDAGRPADIVREILRHAGEGSPLPARLRRMAAMLAAGPRGQDEHFASGCEVARTLAGRLGLAAGVVDGLGFVFERWDGKGHPAQVRGEAIPLPMRIVQVAQDVETFRRVGGREAAEDAVRARRGTALDPAIVDVFLADSAEMVDDIERVSAWDQVLAVEPDPRPMLSGEWLEEALLVIADFADLKSPDTAGHSRGVAALTAAAMIATDTGGPGGTAVAESVTQARHAGLLHDLGRVGVSNGVWDAPRSLTNEEWERVRLHPYLTSRILARLDGLSPIAELGASHHERVDGRGYFRQLAATQLSPVARVLCAADAYQAMTEPRRWRPALEPRAASEQLRTMGRDGRLDPEAVRAVLEAAGHRVARRGDWPAGLSNREVEVLRLAVRGHPNRAIADTLVISERTVAHHLEHAYGKIGVAGRGAAALWSMRHGLLTDLELPAD